jgi:hypothetical protein
MDRRTIWAILLMMVIAVAPALFLKRSAPRVGGEAGRVPSGRVGSKQLEEVKLHNSIC